MADNNQGWKIDRDNFDMFVHNLGEAEKVLRTLVDNVRSEVLVPGYEAWNDPYGEKLLGTIDECTTNIYELYEGICHFDINMKKAANSRLQASDGIRPYTETTSGGTEV